MILRPAKQKHDGWAVRAELGRRGLTFKAMAVESGFSASTLRAALVKPSSHANLFIAKSLGISAHELWPDWFFEDGELIPAKLRKKLSRYRSENASPESRVA
jgi:Ner family transcriptional regulator